MELFVGLRCFFKYVCSSHGNTRGTHIIHLSLDFILLLMLIVNLAH